MIHQRVSGLYAFNRNQIISVPDVIFLITPCAISVQDEKQFHLITIHDNGEIGFHDSTMKFDGGASSGAFESLRPNFEIPALCL